ncbi:MAG: hypothetical protein ACP5JP_04390 [bacterium]
MRIIRLIFSSALLIIIFSHFCYADSLLLTTTPGSAGMGGAFGSLANDNGAIIINPAGISATKRYGAEVGYLNTNPYTGSRLDLSVVDSVTSPVGAGFGYYRESYNESSLKIQKNVYALALSMGEPGIFSAGITGRLDQFTHGLSGQAETLGYGIIFSPGVPFLNISLAGLNLTRIKGNREQLSPRVIDTGISMLLHGIFTIAFDAVKNLDVDADKSMDYHAGGEIVIAHQVAFRGGYAWETAENTKTYSAGIAWDAPRFTLAYTFVGDVEHQKDNTQLVSFTLYPF